VVAVGVFIISAPRPGSFSPKGKRGGGKRRGGKKRESLSSDWRGEEVCLP